jgi:hypothetical protein
LVSPLSSCAMNAIFLSAANRVYTPGIESGGG